MNLTEKSIDALGIPPGKTRVRVKDDRQPGLFLTVGARTKTWELKHREVWHRIGSYPALDIQAARNATLEYLASLSLGRPVGLTVQRAYEMWRRSNASLSPTTLAHHAGHFVHLEDWKNRKLESITPQECRARHERLTKKVPRKKQPDQKQGQRAAGGPGIANNVMHSFAAWWNEAMRVDRRLPRSPTSAVNWNKQPKKDESRLLANLAEWNRRLDAVIGNPMRVALYRFALLTGLRANDVRTMRWEAIEGGMLRLPKPKGGEERAFSIPLVDAHMALLTRGQGPWVWPAVNRTGPLGELDLTTTERRAFKDLPWTPHSLRRVWLSAAVEARLTDAEMRLLVNHNVPGVTGTYIANLIDLRNAMERVVSRLQSRMAAG